MAVGNTARSGARRAGVGVLCLALLVLGACSGDDDDTATGPGTSSTRAAVTTTTRPRPGGPAADLSSTLDGGNGVFMGEGTPPDLERDAYVQREYVAAGTATAYKETAPRTKDGRWTFEPDGTAPYRTRVVVRAPKDAAKFSGTVMVEWLNVSGGVDANPEWVSTAEEIVRSGDVWVGVSAQRIGVEGGPVIVKVEKIPGAEAAGKGLKAIDPERYGSLSQPGDGFSFDIFTQVARALRTGAGLEGLQPKQVIAGGESQSAIALVTYYNGIQPLTEAFDGFFVHSRGSVGLPLVEPGDYADLAGSFGGTPTIFRTDLDAPVMDIQTETDVASILDSYSARQPDSDRFRLWEVAGTAHADAHLVGENADALDCGAPINNGPMHIVAKAAYHALKEWLATGTAPVRAPRLDVMPGDQPTVRRDQDGIARGGIRTPPVDVPVASLSGAAGPNPSTICLLLGSAKPLPAARIAARYRSRADYEQQFEQSVDETIEAGFALGADRDALLAFAEPARVPAG